MANLPINHPSQNSFWEKSVALLKVYSDFSGTIILILFWIALEGLCWLCQMTMMINI